MLLGLRQWGVEDLEESGEVFCRWRRNASQTQTNPKEQASLCQQGLDGDIERGAVSAFLPGEIFSCICPIYTLLAGSFKSLSTSYLGRQLSLYFYFEGHEIRQGRLINIERCGLAKRSMSGSALGPRSYPV